MGKDLKGKELGTGLSQRSDGKYCARVRVGGKDRIKYAKTLSEVKKWLTEMQYIIDTGSIYSNEKMRVDVWYENWLKISKVGKVADSSVSNYNDSYRYHISPVIGDMMIKDVRTIHCQKVLDIMVSEDLSNATIRKARSLMHDIFESAVENRFIQYNPVTKSVKAKGYDTKERYIMSVEEESRLLEAAKESIYYSFFAFILQTGLRCGEASALKWSDIDFESKTFKVQKTLKWDRKEKRFVEKPPKTKAGYRTVPLSDEAIRILMLRKEINKSLPMVFEYHDYVFKNGKGKPSCSSTINIALKRYVKRIGIPDISVHNLRHTFATRCIEAGLRPKTLQKILGHSSIGITMNLYVHVTNDELVVEFQKFQNATEHTIGVKLA